MKSKIKEFGKSALITIPTITPKTSGSVDPKDVVSRAIDFGLFFVGAIALVFVIWGGVQFITAGGEPDKVTKAKNTLLYSILGIIVVALAYLIVKWAGGAPIVT